MTDSLNPNDDFEIDLGLGEEASPADEVEIELDLPEAAESESDEVELAEEEPATTSAEQEDANAAAIAQLRDEIESKYGDWYVIHTYSGMEKRVKQNIDSRVSSLNMEDFIFESVVPTEDVVEIRNNTRKTVTRCVLPGYVLVRMELTDESWSAIRHTPSVTGFVGHGHDPVPLSTDEVVKMLTPSVVSKVTAEAKAPSVKKKVEVVDFAVGDSVMVTEGPFTGVHATITEINPQSSRLKALVEILGRETPVDLEFRQVEKVV